MRAGMGPAMPRTPTPARSRNAPIDPFAPPEASAVEQLLELADDELGHRAQRRVSTPPAFATELPPGGLRGASATPPHGGAAQRSSPSLPPDRPGPADSSGSSARLGPPGSPGSPGLP